MQPLTLAYSPCPNDTFMFEALVHHRLKSRLKFQPFLHDVETLNLMAREGVYDITKISYSNYPAVSDKYLMLTAGAALGSGCGPLLVAGKELPLNAVKDLRIAIPGRNTTANLLFSFFFPEAKNKTEMVFSDIENALLDGRVDAGLLIHENRFTYASRGLFKIADLGEIWEKTTGTPVPLGCIIVRRSIANEVRQDINKLLVASIQTAFKEPEAAMPYVREHAREMEDPVMKNHIALYVNKFSLDLDSEGRKAVHLLFRKGAEYGLLPPVGKDVFVDDRITAR